MPARTLAIALAVAGAAAARGAVPSDPTTAAAVLGGDVRNVREFGARGDGIHDDTQAIQAALDSGKGQPVVVFFPPGEYRVAPTGPGRHALYVRQDNVRILGAGRAASTIKSYAPGGHDPIRSWSVHEGHPWRGSAFFVEGPIRRHVEIGNLRITGQTPRESSRYASLDDMAPFPPRSDSGDGWGGYHSAVMWDPGKTFDDFHVHDCELDSWRAEVLMYSGAAYSFTRARIERNLIHDSLGSMISMSANAVIADNELYGGAHGIEIFHYQANVTVERNWIHDNVSGIGTGGNVSIGAEPYGRFIIRNNLFQRNRRHSVAVVGYAEGYEIVENLFLDGPNGTERNDIHVGSLYGGTPRGLHIARNEFRADAVSPWCGIWLTGGLRDVLVEGNFFTRSSAAEKAGRRVQHSFRHALTTGASVTFTRNDTSGAAFMPAVGDKSTPGATMPLLAESNEYGASGNPHANEYTRDGEVRPYWPVVNLIGDVERGYSRVKGIRAEGSPDGQVVTFRPIDSSRPVYLPLTGKGFKMRRPRFLKTGTERAWVKLRYDAASHVWTELEVGPEGGGVPAEHLFAPGEDGDSIAPVMKFYGERSLSLTPVSERAFSEFADAPFDEPLVVKVAPKATLRPSPTLRLAGDRPFSSPSGGVVTFVRPAGRNELFEVSRSTYDAPARVR